MVTHKPMIHQKSNFYTIFTFYISFEKNEPLKNYGVQK